MNQSIKIAFSAFAIATLCFASTTFAQQTNQQGFSIQLSRFQGGGQTWNSGIQQQFVQQPGWTQPAQRFVQPGFVQPGFVQPGTRRPGYTTIPGNNVRPVYGGGRRVTYGVGCQQGGISLPTSPARINFHFGGR